MFKKFTPLPILFILSLACRLTASDAPPATDLSPQGGTPTQATPTLTTLPLPTTVAYKTVAGVDPDLLSLDIHAPADAHNAPVVIWVHGGGYAIGDKAYQMKDKITLFNGQGWILISVNYRLSAPDKGAAQYPDRLSGCGGSGGLGSGTHPSLRRRPEPHRLAGSLGRRRYRLKCGGQSNLPERIRL